MYAVAKDEFTAAELDVYHALAYAVRDRLMERWFLTQDAYYRSDAKRVYYLSMEFLPGRLLLNNILSLGAHPAYCPGRRETGLRPRAASRSGRWDPGLGNGGLGRLAACFLDSAATLALPFFGYGIRYEYGIFRQRIEDGQQVEAPDNWLRVRQPLGDSPARRPYPGAALRAHRSRSATRRATSGRTGWTPRTSTRWRTTRPCRATGNDTVNTLRLWSAQSSREFDLAPLQRGRLRPRRRGQDAVARTSRRSSTRRTTSTRARSCGSSSSTSSSSATLQDVLRRFKKSARGAWRSFPTKVAIQLNDTHPALAIPSSCACSWTGRSSTGTRVGDHPGGLRLHEPHGPARRRSRRGPSRSSAQAAAAPPRDHRGDRPPLPGARAQPLPRRRGARRARRSIVRRERRRRAHGAPRHRREPLPSTAWRQIHTEILKADTFARLPRALPGPLQNKTNGITPRRWLLKCNPGLAAPDHGGDRGGMDRRTSTSSRGSRRSPEDAGVPGALDGRQAREQGAPRPSTCGRASTASTSTRTLMLRRAR